MIIPKFVIGKVHNVVNTFKNFEFEIELEDQELVPVRYTSPFFNYGGGGVIAPPQIGNMVLCLYDDASNQYYYISTIVSTNEYPWVYDPSPGIVPLIKDKNFYTDKNIPQKIHFTNEVDSGLRISRKKLKKYIDSKVELKSEFGKKVSLIDSPTHSHVLIRNEHGDGIRIVSHDWPMGKYPNPIYPTRSIVIVSKGPQFYNTFNGSMNMAVTEGTEFNIQNFSTGTHGSNGSSTIPAPPGETTKASPENRVGNINLRSKNSDINIAVNGDKSEIYITTPKARLEIREDGTIFINSQASINLKSEGNINMKSSENINIEAGGQVNIKSGDNFNIQSSDALNLKSTNNCNVDGKQVHLNSGFSTAAGSTDEIQIKRNAYGE